MIGRASIRTVLLILPIILALAVVPQFVHLNRVAAQTSTGTPTGTSTTTPTGTTTSTSTPTGTTTVVPITGTGQLTLCGPLTAFTAASATGSGTITVSGITYTIVSGAVVVNSNLLTVGQNVCILATFNSIGQITSLTASTSTTAVMSLAICGTATLYSAATSTAAGTLSIGVLTFTIAPGATVTGATITTGSSYCVQAVLNSSGQITSLSVAVPLAAVPAYGGYVHRWTGMRAT